MLEAEVLQLRLPAKPPISPRLARADSPPAKLFGQRIVAQLDVVH